MMVLLKDYFKKKYNVLFDSDCSKKPVQRIRFTLAHELGHYVLRYFYDKSTNNFRRNSSNDGKNSKFEHEANRFARELLAPVFLVEKFPIYSTKEYIGKCLDISPESASNVISFYKKMQKDTLLMIMVMISARIENIFIKLITLKDAKIHICQIISIVQKILHLHIVKNVNALNKHLKIKSIA